MKPCRIVRGIVIFTLLAGIAMVGSSCAKKEQKITEEGPPEKPPVAEAQPSPAPQPEVNVQTPPSGPQVEPQAGPEGKYAKKGKHHRYAKGHKGTHEGKHEHVASAGGQDIYDALKSAGHFKTLVAAIRDAGLAKTFSGGGKYTLIAPTDRAEGIGELQGKSPHRLQEAVRSHMIKGRYNCHDLKGMGTVITYSGAKLKVGTERGKLALGGARITREINCANGVILVADSTVTPRGGKETAHHKKSAAPKNKSKSGADNSKKKPNTG
jgi:uncharacterized surface protein with fasciclin (FAS1) repeats